MFNQLIYSLKLCELNLNKTGLKLMSYFRYKIQILVSKKFFQKSISGKSFTFKFKAQPTVGKTISIVFFNNICYENIK